MVNNFTVWNCAIDKFPNPTVCLYLLAANTDAAVTISCNTALGGYAKAMHF
jgi:hypothetical protein